MRIIVLGSAMLVVLLAGCNRFRVRHDHSKQMMHVRVIPDSNQRNDIAADDGWQDEYLIEIPSEAGEGSSLDANPDEVERMMKGEDVGI